MANGSSCSRRISRWRTRKKSPCSWLSLPLWCFQRRTPAAPLRSDSMQAATPRRARSYISVSISIRTVVTRQMLPLRDLYMYEKESTCLMWVRLLYFMRPRVYSDLEHGGIYDTVQQGQQRERVLQGRIPRAREILTVIIASTIIAVSSCVVCS